VPHDVRDPVVDFVRRWSEKTEIGVGRFPPWLGVSASKFYDWRQRYGRVNEHNGWIPRDFWLEAWEKEAIIAFHHKESAGRVSAADLHDAGCRCGGGESGQCLAGAETNRTVVAMEKQTVTQGNRLRAAAAAASTSARLEL
jgi:hypothetical protein